MMKMIKHILGSLLITIFLFSFAGASTSTWQTIGNGETDELNISNTMNAHDPIIAIDASTPYVAWSEFDGNNSAYQIVLKKHNGSGWETINPSLNMIPTDNGTSPTMLFRGSEIIIAWVETDPSASRIYAKSILVGDGGSSMLGNFGLNMDFYKNASDPTVVIIEGDIYAAWAEAGPSVGQPIQLSKYISPSWVSLSADISMNASAISSEPVLAPDQGSPYKAYIAWVEHNGNANQLYVKHFNGSIWEEPKVGALNKIVTKDANSPDLKVYNSTPFVCWSENTDTVPKVYVKMFNGSDWISLGEALNCVPEKAATNPKLVIDSSGAPIVTWQEDTNSGQVIKVARHEVGSWIFKSDALNMDPANNGVKPSIAILNSRPVVAWQESTTSAQQVFVKHDSTVSATPTPDGSESPTPEGSTTPNPTATPDSSGTAEPTPTPGTTAIKTPTPTTINKEKKVKIKDNVFQPGKGVPVSIEVPVTTREKVVIKIYNRRGQHIKTVVDEIVNPGDFQAVWDGQNEKNKLVGSGVYIVHIKTDSINEKRKIAVVQ